MFTVETPLTQLSEEIKEISAATDFMDTNTKIHNFDALCS